MGRACHHGCVRTTRTSVYARKTPALLPTHATTLASIPCPPPHGRRLPSDDCLKRGPTPCASSQHTGHAVAGALAVQPAHSGVRHAAAADSGLTHGVGVGRPRDGLVRAHKQHEAAVQDHQPPVVVLKDGHLRNSLRLVVTSSLLAFQGDVCRRGSRAGILWRSSAS